MSGRNAWSLYRSPSRHALSKACLISRKPADPIMTYIFWTTPIARHLPYTYNCLVITWLSHTSLPCLLGFHCDDWASFVCDVTSPISVQFNTTSPRPITDPFLGLYNIKCSCWEDRSRIWFHDEKQICARSVLSFIPQLSKQGGSV